MYAEERVSSREIVVFTDQLPFPPRNGITLPIYNYLILLVKKFKIKIFLFHDVNQDINHIELQHNEALFGKVHLIGLKRKNKFFRIKDEIFLEDMFQHGWVSDNSIGNQLINTLDKNKSILIVSPMSAVAKLNSMGVNPEDFQISVAAVNDCTTSEYYYRDASIGNSLNKIKAKIDRYRCFFISRIERKILGKYKNILLQTNTDIELMASLVSGDISKKCIRVSNGVSEQFFDLSPSPRKKEIIFVAEMSGEYSPIALWLVNDLWPIVMAKNNQYSLILIGKGASANLKKSIARSSQVRHIEFVENLIDVYKDASIAISPVFKGFGLINKTLEAMAAGIPVIGGLAAFNGIDGFRNGHHGLACKKLHVDEFSNALLHLMNDEVMRTRIGVNGRSLVKGQFQWGGAVSIIEDLFNPNN